jgi:AcrR family transcriptional regulator
MNASTQPQHGATAPPTKSRREDIVLVAAEMFATKGYADTGVDEIGEAVGITGPALYRHFANKQALVDALCLDGMKSLLAEAKSVVELESESAEEVLDQLINARIEFAFGPHRHSFAIRHNANVHLSPKAQQQLTSMEGRYRDEWMRVLIRMCPTTATSDLHIAWVGIHQLVGFTAMYELSRYSALYEDAVQTAALKEQLFRMAKAAILA